MIDIQPTLENATTLVEPLQEEDFAALFAVASDPKIWEQHPNKDRWQKEIFQNFFEGAMQSKGAFKIIDKSSHTIIGSTRFYNYDQENDSILIGYTFYSTNCWGKGINAAVKKCMFSYIFQFVSTILFHVGSTNIRSQMAMKRLGCTQIGEEEVAYFGEPSKLNFVYRITKEEWLSIDNKDFN